MTPISPWEDDDVRFFGLLVAMYSLLIAGAMGFLMLSQLGVL